jgi:integrase
MANIEKRNANTYRIVVSAGYDSNGKKIRKYKTVTLPDDMTDRQREKELNRAAILFEQEVESGTYLDGAKITFSEFARKWLTEYAERRLVPGTLNPYRMKLEKRILPAIGHIKLAKLQPQHLLQFYANLEEDGARLDAYYIPSKHILDHLGAIKGSGRVVADEMGVDRKTLASVSRGERVRHTTAMRICEYFGLESSKAFVVDDSVSKLSSKSIKSHHDLIMSILNTACQWNILLHNPALRLKPPKLTKGKPKYYGDVEITSLFVALEKEPMKYKVLTYLTVDTGLRLSEIAGLVWSDIDFNKGTLCVQRQRQYVSGYGIITKTTKTESGLREITVSKTVLDMLKRYRTMQMENRLMLGAAWVECDNVFTHEDGTALYPDRPAQWFRGFVQRHDLPPINFHGLRHSNASLMIAAGVDVVTLSGRLGHADKNITLNTYSHIIKSKEQQAANHMDIFYGRMAENALKTAP